MNAAALAAKKPEGYVYGEDTKKAFTASLLLHISVVVVGVLGLPFLSKEPVIQEMAITVEMVDLADISQSALVAPPQKQEKEEPAPPPAPAPPKPVFNTPSESAPELVTPQAPEIEEVPEPPKEEKVAELPKPEKPKPPKPLPKPVNKPKPKPPEVKKEPVKEEKPKEEEPDISSLLASVLNESAPAAQPTEQPSEQTESSQLSQIADFSTKFTRSEEDDLNRGVEPCWNVNAGGKDAEKLIVSLRVFVNPDMTVREVQIIDQIRYSTDTHFKAAAEAARRALLNPKCSTLRLPPEKYEQWKVFKYNFDPSHML